MEYNQQVVAQDSLLLGQANHGLRTNWEEDPVPSRSAGSSPDSVLNSCRTEMTAVPMSGAVAEEREGKLREAAPQELLTLRDEVKE